MYVCLSDAHKISHILTLVSGSVDWDEFCTYMMRDLEEKTSMRNERDLPLLVAPQLLDAPHRSIIKRIQIVSNRIITVSEDAVVCFWSMKLAPVR